MQRRRTSDSTEISLLSGLGNRCSCCRASLALVTICCWASRICCSVLARKERGPRGACFLLKVHSIPMATQRSHGTWVHLTLRILQASQDREPIFRFGVGLDMFAETLTVTCCSCRVQASRHILMLVKTPHQGSQRGRCTPENTARVRNLASSDRFDKCSPHIHDNVQKARSDS